MRKLITIISTAVFVLFSGLLAMAQQAPASKFDNAYEARAYHESFGPGSSLGGWKFSVYYQFAVDQDTEAAVKNHEVEFVNKSNDDSFITKPHYCYNVSSTTRSCDALVWFGNRLNVTDGETADSPISDWEVYIDGTLSRTFTPVSEKFNYFQFVTIDKMYPAGQTIQLTYTVPEKADTYIRLQIQDSDFNVIKTYTSTAGELTFGSKQKIYLPAEYAGYNARFEQRTNDNSVRKILWLKLPASN